MTNHDDAIYRHSLIGGETSFYTNDELAAIGFAHVGEGVKISRFARIYHPENIYLHDKCRVDDFCILSAGLRISIGRAVHISCYTVLHGCDGTITLDRYAAIGAHCVVLTRTDDYSGRSMVGPEVPEICKPKKRRGNVALHPHTVVGAQCIVMPKTVLREGAVVAAQSVTMGVLKPWTINKGNPAKKTGDRARDLLELEKLID